MYEFQLYTPRNLIKFGFVFIIIIFLVVCYKKRELDSFVIFENTAKR